MAEKQCPICDRTWAETFRFCPEDGTGLVSASAATSAQAAARFASRATVFQAPAVVEAVAPVASAPASTAAAPEKPAKAKKAFSETAWFLHKIEPGMIDPKTGRVLVDTTALPAEELDAETRKRYSLRTDEDEE